MNLINWKLFINFKRTMLLKHSTERNHPIPRASPRECSSRMFFIVENRNRKKKKLVKNETKITSNNFNLTQTLKDRKKQSKKTII